MVGSPLADPEVTLLRTRLPHGCAFCARPIRTGQRAVRLATPRMSRYYHVGCARYAS